MAFDQQMLDTHTHPPTHSMQWDNLILISPIASKIVNLQMNTTDSLLECIMIDWQSSFYAEKIIIWIFNTIKLNLLPFLETINQSTPKTCTARAVLRKISLL